MPNQYLIVSWDRVRKQNKQCCCPMLLPLNTIVDYFSTSHPFLTQPDSPDQNLVNRVMGSWRMVVRGKKARESFEFGPVTSAD